MKAKPFAGLFSRLTRTLLAVVLFASAGACDGIFGSDNVRFADTARVLVTNEPPLPLLLVTSTNFGLRTDPLTGTQIVILVRADTIRFSTTTFDRTFDIQGRDRFYSSLINPDTARTATVHLRVHLDDREVYTQRATLRDAALQYVNFFGAN